LDLLSPPAFPAWPPAPGCAPSIGVQRTVPCGPNSNLIVSGLSPPLMVAVLPCTVTVMPLALAAGWPSFS